MHIESIVDDKSIQMHLSRIVGEIGTSVDEARAIEIQRRIAKHANTTEISKLGKNSMERSILLVSDCLDSCRPINMSYGLETRVQNLMEVEHIGAQFGRGKVFANFLSAANWGDWSKRFPSLYSIQSMQCLFAEWACQNGAMAKCARADF